MLAEVKRLEAVAQEAGKEREAAEQALRRASQVLSLLSLLVQKYKY
jgi:hypothetical protein